MEVKIKRIYEAPEENDGKRIFVDRLWARGLTKEKAQLDRWVKEVAPSTDLRKWYGHDPERFEEFRDRYRQELEANPEAERLAKELAGEDRVTLLCGAKDLDHSNAAVLKEWLEEKMADGPADPFYSQENMTELEGRIADAQEGRNMHEHKLEGSD